MTTLPLASVGAGLCVIGAGVGIGLVFSSAIQSMARQPEMAPKLQVMMWIGAALIEGFALFAMVFCFLQLK